MSSGCGLFVFLCIFASLSLIVNAGYGNVGGPIAKSPRKKPNSKTRTTQFPDVDTGIDEPDFKDQNAKINPDIINQSNWTVPAIEDKPQFFAPAPGDYGDMCCWEPHQDLILNDFASGKAKPPFYGFISEESCSDEATCLHKCAKEKCNLAIWNSANQSARLFVAHKDKLSNLIEADNFTKQAGTDTLIRRCLRQYDITPGCKELVASNCPLCDEFITFVTKYNKTYKGCEFVRRFEIFKLNKLKIAGLNDKRILDDDATFTVTRFTDRMHDEFLKLFTGAKEEKGTNVVGDNVVKDQFVNATGDGDLNLRFDWTKRGVIPVVRDQQECGSCYAFTSTDLVAAQFLIDRGQFGKSYTLAPQYVLDCFRDPAAYGCDGGRPVKVMETLSKCGNGGKNGGGCEFPLETCLPYKNEASNLCEKPSCPGAPKIKVEKYGMVDLSNDYLEKQKMAGLLHRGPLVVQVDANDAWQFYESGIIRAHQCTTKTNHAVLVTGYDFGVAVPAYIIRNTWSEEWGRKGYVYLEAGVNACGVGQAVTYVCTGNCSVFPASPQPSSGSTTVPKGSSGSPQPGTSGPQPYGTQPQPQYGTSAPQPHPQPNYAAASSVAFPLTQSQPPQQTSTPQSHSPSPSPQPPDQSDIPTTTSALVFAESTGQPDETPVVSSEPEKLRDYPDSQIGGSSRIRKTKVLRVQRIA